MLLLQLLQALLRATTESLDLDDSVKWPEGRASMSPASVHAWREQALPAAGATPLRSVRAGLTPVAHLTLGCDVTARDVELAQRLSEPRVMTSAGLLTAPFDVEWHRMHAALMGQAVNDTAETVDPLHGLTPEGHAELLAADKFERHERGFLVCK